MSKIVSKKQVKFIDLSDQAEQKLLKLTSEIIGSNAWLRIVHFAKERKDILLYNEGVFQLVDFILDNYRTYCIKKLKNSGVEIK